MARKYFITTGSQSVSAVQDMLELVAASGKPVRIWEAHITKQGDVTSENLHARIRSGQTTSGSGGGTGVVATPLNPDDSAFAGTVSERNNTTQASAGTIVTRHEQGFNLLSGYHFVATREDEAIKITAGERFTLELIVAPAAARNMIATLLIEE